MTQPDLAFGESQPIPPEVILRPEVILEALVNQQARVAGDILEIEGHTWAIHGVIPVDGDVIIAEFDSPQDAHAVLDQIAIVDEARP